MKNGFTQKAQNALEAALNAASGFGHTYIGSEHILMGLLSDSDCVAAKLLENRGISLDKVREIISEIAGTGEKTVLSPSDMTPRTKRIIESSAYIAANSGSDFIGTEHLLLALLGENDCVAVKILASAGVSIRELYSDATSFAEGFSTMSGEQREADFKSDMRKGGTRGDKKSQSASKDNLTYLSQYGRDLTRAAKEGKIDPIIGRDEEMSRVIQILSRRTKNNPCLIGEPGVGKTAVVEGLAQLISDGAVPETLIGKTVYTLDISSMIAGAKYRGEFEERMKGVMGEVAKNPNIILFIDEIHTIIGAGAAEGAVDAANIIKPALARGEMQLIGATTINEYRKYIEKDAALERRFQSVTVGEPTPEESVKILHGLRDKYEAHHKIKITDEAIDAAVNLSKRYITDRYLPDKAIDLIDEAASKKRISNCTVPGDIKTLEQKYKSVAAEKEEAIKLQDFERAARLRDEEKRAKEEYEKAHGSWSTSHVSENIGIDADDIADIVTAWTGIPVKKLAGEESEKLLRLDELLKARVIGQDEAVSAVARAIRRGRAGLKDPKRPMGSFIFLGPTGVGKTELSKALAELLFGDESAMIRVDMSEYMEKHSVSKMIGSPPGYVGYDEGGQLTEKIRRRPYSVVLFDEIEKAHPDVFNMLLQVLEDGMLTDAQGRRVDFKNTVIIMTSNVGASAITERRSSLGFAAGGGADNADDKKRTQETVMSYLKDTFKPEFINRVDEIIVFNKLGEEDIKKIASIMVAEVSARIEAVGISIEFSDEVISLLAKEGIDPIYGARPLRREIQKRIEDTFSTAMLSGEFVSGDSVRATQENGEIKYVKV